MAVVETDLGPSIHDLGTLSRTMSSVALAPLGLGRCNNFSLSPGETECMVLCRRFDYLLKRGGREKATREE